MEVQYVEYPDTKQEKWKPIPGFDLYVISNLGNLRKCYQGDLRVAKLITGWIHHKGYRTVRLSYKGKRKMFSIHQLVALAFFGKRPRQLETRHLNGIKTDNKVSNLRYGTRSENRLDEFKHKPWLRKAISVGRINYWKRRKKLCASI